MIKFRGIPLESVRNIYGVDFDGTFVYGNYVKYGDGSLIVGDAEEADEETFWPSWWVPVDPKTVKQFTGLKDVNDKEIYIGDIVKYRNLEEKYQYLKIRWLQQDCMVDAGGYRIDIVARRCEVIGNVHENAELLEE